MQLDYIIELFFKYNEFEDVEFEILGVLKRMAMKNDECKINIGKSILSQCLKNLSPQGNKSGKIKDITLQMLVLLSKEDEEFVKEIERNDGKNLIKSLIQKEGKDSSLYKQGLYLISKMNKKN
jgi:hypothetical protein